MSVVFVLLALRVTVIITRLTGIFSARSSLLSGGRLALKGIVLFLLRFLMLRSGSIRQVYKGSSCYFIARQLSPGVRYVEFVIGRNEMGHFKVGVGVF